MVNQINRTSYNLNATLILYKIMTYQLLYQYCNCQRCFGIILYLFIIIIFFDLFLNRGPSLAAFIAFERSLLLIQSFKFILQIFVILSIQGRATK